MAGSRPERHRESDLPPDVPLVRDEELRKVVARWHRLRWVLTGMMLFVVAGALVIFGYILFRDEARLSATCAFYRDVSGVPLSPAPGNHSPSQLGVEIVVDSRLAYQGLRCSPDLLPPSATLQYWARHYHLGVPT